MIFRIALSITVIGAMAAAYAVDKSRPPGETSEVSDSVPENAPRKWPQEPLSFLDIKLREALVKSAASECPEKEVDVPQFRAKLKIPDGRAILALPKGSRCYTRSNGRFSVTPIGTFPFSPAATVSTDDGTADGKVLSVKIQFSPVRFNDVRNMFVMLYGNPHSETFRVVQEDGGKEIKNRILDWQGDTVHIHLESHAGKPQERADRQFTGLAVATISPMSFVAAR